MKNKINIKNDITTIKKYLVESFYSDSNIKYTIINIDTIKLVIDMLKRKKLIDNRYEFKLTLETVKLLENDLKHFKSYLLSLISISVAVIALSINVFVNIDTLPFIICIITLIFFCILLYYGRNL